MTMPESLLHPRDRGAARQLHIPMQVPPNDARLENIAVEPSEYLGKPHR